LFVSAVLHRYGKLGYVFGRGSYNISSQQYAAAVAHVGSAPLDAIAADFSWLMGEPMQQLLQQYRNRGGCGVPVPWGTGR
jgi:hypothetical protein